ncbi:ABC transporter ATP-binding protein [Natrarchaeobius chitinivorans]|uniref:Nickel import system ATP-binding protein NikD n=1 Tax=Natrarchaeobius chitinivorans TaxID=1679083 RepID=A0A3N6PC06_NATCH|nr:ABC transporter ATP-binding protein [Natrarchaeobius chitinivorans]RQG94195.1 ABC transporter ATP-binding protein [Natrarchaeobius chitinivorans]
MSKKSILEVRDLHTQFETDSGVVKAVDGVSFSLQQGEIYGLVGESGAGKSVTGRSIMRLIDPPGNITDGTVRFNDENLLTLPMAEVRDIRGNEIAMIFQNAMAALNPGYTIGTQISDVLQRHKDFNDKQARERTIQLLSDVGIPDPEARFDSYPHQLSGGMCQRVVIAMALSCDPDIIIADEPTTALDVTIQAQILELLSDLRDNYGITVLLITHNMGVVASTCDRVGVMYAGEVVEEGPVQDIVAKPRHPYTMGLMQAVPRLNDARERLESIPGDMPNLLKTPNGCSFHPRCPYDAEDCRNVDPSLDPLSPDDRSTERRTACLRTDEIDFDREMAEMATEADGKEGSPKPKIPNRGRTDSDPLIEASNLQKYFDPESQSWLDRLIGEREYVHAVDDVSLDIYEGETLGLVGESGCGKTTLGRVLSHLYEPDAGTVVYAGTDLTELDRRKLKSMRGNIQMIFQDPVSSLNPRKSVYEIISRPLEIHQNIADEVARRERVEELLDSVGLKPEHASRKPHAFSGGQKQRIGIARALAVEPDFIVADEPVSALDVSIQAKIINLLMDLQEEFNLTYVFIAHDLNVVQHIADRIAVMYLGEIIECGDADDIFTPPHHPYTEMLLSSIPPLDPSAETDRIVPRGTPPSPIDPPSGCRFHTRCPRAMEECKSVVPADHQFGEDHTITCHLFDDDRDHAEINALIAEQEAYGVPKDQLVDSD